MHYVFIRCCCVLAVLASMSVVFDSIEAMTTIHYDSSVSDSSVSDSSVNDSSVNDTRVNNTSVSPTSVNNSSDNDTRVNNTSVSPTSVSPTSVNPTSVKPTEFYVVVVESLAQVKDIGNYSYDDMRRNDPIVSAVADQFNGTLNISERTGQCNAYDSSRDFIDILWEYMYDPDKPSISLWKAILVSDCEEACQLVGQIGPSLTRAAGGVAVISDGCPSPEFSNSKRYGTFARVGGILTYLADPMVDLFVNFKVTRVVLVSSLDAAMQHTRMIFSDAFKRSNIDTFEIDLDTLAVSRNDISQKTIDKFITTALFVEEKARYIVFLLRPHHVIRLLQVIRNEFGPELNGDYLFFTLEHRIVTGDEFPDISGDDLASLQEGLVTASRKPFPRNKIKQPIQKRSVESSTDSNNNDNNDDNNDNNNDNDNQLGYVIDAQLVLYSALQFTEPDKDNADIIAHLRSGQMQIHGVTGEIRLDKDGVRRPDYVFLIVQDGRLMPLWTVDSQGDGGVTWINPEAVKWPRGPFPPHPNPKCAWDSSECESKMFSKNVKKR